MNIILFLLILSLVGFLIVGLLLKHFNTLEIVGLSLLVGLGCFSLWFFLIFSYYRILPANIWLGLVTLLLAVFALKILFRKNDGIEPLPKVDLLGCLLMLILIVSSFYPFALALYYPPSTPDALKIYDFRAKRLVESGGVLTDFFFLGNSHMYPPFTSMVHFFLYQAGSENPQFIYPLILYSFLVYVAGYITRLSKSLNFGLLTAIAIVSTPSIYWNSFLSITNIILMVYFSLATLILIDPQQRGPRPPILIGILFGLVSFIRSEPVWMLVVPVVLLLALVRRQYSLPILTWLTFLLVSSVWATASDRSPDPIYQTTIEVVSLNSVVQKVATEKVSGSIHLPILFTIRPFVKSLGVLPPLFVISSICTFGLNRYRISWASLTAYLCTIGLIVGFVNFSSRYNRWTDLGDSLYRYFTILVPLYWISILTCHQPKFFQKTNTSPGD